MKTWHMDMRQILDFLQCYLRISRALALYVEPVLDLHAGVVVVAWQTIEVHDDGSTLPTSHLVWVKHHHEAVVVHRLYRNHENVLVEDIVLHRCIVRIDQHHLGKNRSTVPHSSACYLQTFTYVSPRLFLLQTRTIQSRYRWPIARRYRWTEVGCDRTRWSKCISTTWSGTYCPGCSASSKDIMRLPAIVLLDHGSAGTILENLCS